MSNVTYYILPENYHKRIDSSIMSASQKILDFAKRNALIQEEMQVQFFATSYCLERTFPELKEKHALSNFTMFTKPPFLLKYRPSSESMKNIIWINLAMDESELKKWLLAVAFLISEDSSKEYEIIMNFLSGKLLLDSERYPDKEEYERIMSAASKAEAIIEEEL